MKPSLLCLLIPLFLVGCSSKPPMVPVTGVVTLNGKPVELCQVAFVPDAEDPDPRVHGYGLAYTDAEGRYTMENSFGEPGIFPGNYKVLLVQFTNKAGKPLPRTAKPSETPGGFVNQMPAAYQQPHSTPETITVPRGGTTKDFAIVK